MVMVEGDAGFHSQHARPTPTGSIRKLKPPVTSSPNEESLNIIVKAFGKV
jgi:hypothetical protein